MKIAEMMEKEIQYEIYIGCKDSQTKNEILSAENLKDTISKFFCRKKISFSLQIIEGGYKCEDGVYIYENTVCITIIGDQNLDILKTARGLSMYMNQECFLITKSDVNMGYN